MWRWAFRILMLVSLVPCAGCVGLWVRSYWRADELWVCRTRGINYWVRTRPGSVMVHRTVLTGRTSDIFSDSFDRPAGWSFNRSPVAMPTASPFTAEGSHRAVQWLGFDYLARNDSRPTWGSLKFRRVIVPLWFLSIVSALPLIPLWRHFRRSRRWERGLCATCGYDLRASS